MSYMTHIEKSGVNDLFQELQQRVAEEGVASYNQYLELIDELIEKKKSCGALEDDDDISQIKADLELMWNSLRK